jgi:hypothetical protein
MRVLLTNCSGYLAGALRSPGGCGCGRFEQEIGDSGGRGNDGSTREWLRLDNRGGIVHAIGIANGCTTELQDDHCVFPSLLKVNPLIADK